MGDVNSLLILDRTAVTGRLMMWLSLVWWIWVSLGLLVHASVTTLLKKTSLPFLCLYSSMITTQKLGRVTKNPVALLEDQICTYVRCWLTNVYNSISRRIWCLLLSSVGTPTHVAYTHTHRHKYFLKSKFMHGCICLIFRDLSCLYLRWIAWLIFNLY